AGSVYDSDCFYVATYTPDSLIPLNVLATGLGDIGMHLLVASPAGRAMHGLTDRIMAEVIDFFLRPADQGGRGGRRVVVEPDARNDAVSEKNRAAGFSPVRESRILMAEAEKRALVSVCTRADFDATALAPLVRAVRRDDGAPHVYAHLIHSAVDLDHRHLVAQGVTNFALGRAIAPLRVSDDVRDVSADAGALGPTSGDAGNGTWELAVDGGTRYTFTARLLPLEHWVIDEDSITRRRD